MPTKASQIRRSKCIPWPVRRVTVPSAKAAKPTRSATMVKGGRSETATPTKKNEPPQRIASTNSRTKTRGPRVLSMPLPVARPMVLTGERRMRHDGRHSGSCCLNRSSRERLGSPRPSGVAIHSSFRSRLVTRHSRGILGESRRGSPDRTKSILDCFLRKSWEMRFVGRSLSAERRPAHTMMNSRTGISSMLNTAVS